jgi:ABC-type nickel/cobalt efflux system permease component RcnA/Tol biopolymer transport system component
MYLHHINVQLKTDHIQVVWTISPGPLLADSIWNAADKNADGAVTSQEAFDWTRPISSSMFIQLDGETLSWNIDSVQWPTTYNQFLIGDQKITINLSQVSRIPISGSHRLVIINQFDPTISINWYELYGEDGITFSQPEQKGNRLDANLWIPSGVNGYSPPDPSIELNRWNSGDTSLSVDANNLVSSAANNLAGNGSQISAQNAANDASSDNRPSAILERLLRTTGPSSWLFYISALLIALVLGALHALTPGHGKTIIASYLIGTRGKVKHAVVLGSIVTLTHTGSVFALGLLALSASRYFLPADITPVLELLSGMIILCLGIGLLFQRYNAWKEERIERFAARPYHPTFVASNASTRGGRIIVNEEVREHGSAHHHHGPKILPAKGSVSWRSIITLGISGGIVPCPDAIAVLLVAITLNRILMGLYLILAFSLGLASILIAIGVAMVQSQQVIRKFRVINRFESIIPIVSACVVIGLGLGLALTTFVNNPGIFSINKLATVSQKLTNPSGQNLAIKVNSARTMPATQTPFLLNLPAHNSGGVLQILYTASDIKSQFQLFLKPLNGQVNKITDAPYGVLDYAYSKAAEKIVYAAATDTGRSDLWMMNFDGSDQTRLVVCPDAVCYGPVWSSNGKSFLYERRNLTGGDASQSLPTAWWFDLLTGQNRPVFQDSQLPTTAVNLSPDQQWLNYMIPNNNDSVLYNIKARQSVLIPNSSGTTPVWSPQGDSFLTVNWINPKNQPKSQLLLYQVKNNQSKELISDPNFQNYLPAWSPDGAWIAFVRQAVDSKRQSWITQIWMLRPNGGDEHPIVKDPDYSYSQPSWFPDGKSLLLTREKLASGGGDVEIVVFHVDTGAIQIMGNGLNPVLIQ